MLEMAFGWFALLSRLLTTRMVARQFVRMPRWIDRAVGIAFAVFGVRLLSIVQRDASINRSALTYLELAGLTSGCCPLDGFVRRENGEHGGQIPLGAKGAFALHVRPEHLANQFKDAMLPQVLATPIMILIMENAALKLSGRFWNWVRAQSVPQ